MEKEGALVISVENSVFVFIVRLTWNAEGILKVIELGNSQTEDQENVVDENIEVELRHFIRERQTQNDVIETTIETSAEKLLATEPTNKTECRTLL